MRWTIRARHSLSSVRFNTFCPFGKNNLVRLIRLCDKNKLLTKVSKLCKLVEKMSEMDYKSKTHVCDRGTGNEQLDYLCGITVDHNTGNIYVADYNDKLFDNTARYLFKFGDGKEMGRCLILEDYLFVVVKYSYLTSHNHCILAYQLYGKYVPKSVVRQW